MNNNEKIRFYEFNHKKHKNNILYINGIFFCFLFLILSIYLFYLASNKKVINKLSYKPISSVNYVTYYDDNEVNYDVYVRNYLNYITASFNYNSIFDRKIDGKTFYSVESYYYVYNTGYKNEKIYISERKNLYPLSEKEIKNQKEIVNEASVKIDYKEYLQRYLSYKASSKVSCQGLLIVEFKVNNNVKTNDVEDNNSSVTKLEIPLSESTFKITSSSTSNGKTVKINELEKNGKSVKTKFTLSFIFAFLSVIDFIIIIIFNIKDSKCDNLYDKKLRKILRSYDNVIVETNNLPDIKDKNIIYVKSFNELLDAQIQVNTPINYKEDESIATFMLASGDMVWIYKMNKD